MADSYQAIYDAVRSRISNGDIGQAVADVVRQNFDTSRVMATAENMLYEIKEAMTAPHVLLKPAVTAEDDGWWCRYAGVTGWGKTPEAAAKSFDASWRGTVT